MSFFNQLASSVQDTLHFYKRRRQFDDLFKYICKQAPHHNVGRQARELNALLDPILEDFGQQLRSRSWEKVPVNDIDHEFHRRWLRLNLYGTFRGDQGLLEDLSSLRRKDNCALAIPGPAARVFSFNLQLRKLILEFERYELRCGPVHAKGRLSVEARDNMVSVSVTLALKKGDKVDRVEVTRAEIVKFSKFKVRVTGFGAIGGNSLAKVVLRLLIKKQINQRKAELEHRLKTLIMHAIESFTM